jgi:pilus assembly protein CpaF
MTGRPQPATDTRTPVYQALKGKIHQELLNRLNLDKLTRTSKAEAEPEIRLLIQGLLDRENQRVPLSLSERESLVGDVLNELFGLGPLEALLKDGNISDILINNSHQVFIEREGRLEETDIVFRDDKHLMQIIERIVSAVGRRIDESTPMVDARLQDGSRVNVIIPPLALDGPTAAKAGPANRSWSAARPVSERPGWWSSSRQRRRPWGSPAIGV